MNSGHSSSPERDTNERRGLSERFKSFRTVGPLLGAGMQLAIVVVVFFLLGRWLDEKFSTSPWLMIVGAAIGFAGGLYAFIRAVNEVEDMEKKKSP